MTSDFANTCWQPSACAFGMSAVARVGVGVIQLTSSTGAPLGSSRGSAASTAAPSADVRGVVSGGVDVARVNRSTRPAVTPTRLKFAPRLSANRGDRDTAVEYLIGFSTKRYVNQAGTKDAPTTASPSRTDSSPQSP